MSEAEDTRPLTRRERRIKEFGETGALPLLNADGTSRLTNPQTLDEDIHVDPLDEHGNPRSRREIREIREKLRLQQAAQIVRETEQSREAEAQAEPDKSEASAAAVSGGEQTPEVPAEPAVAADLDTANTNEVEIVETVATVVEEELILDEVPAEPAVTDEVPFEELFSTDISDAPTRTFGELPSDIDGDADRVENDAFSPETLVADVVSETESPAEVEVELEVVTAEAVVVADAVSDAAADESAEVVTVEVTAEEVIIEASEEPQPVQAKRATYTYPDITPLDDEVSVFDDPTVRTISGNSKAAPAFDDLISRAVAQEGSAGSTNTSALILPRMPDTESLAGPLGETGELFITGSIDLPRSFSETGGHASLIDSVDADRLEEFGAADQHPQESGIVPVSATRAVSARVIPGPVVTEAQKEKSKLPVVLISTGGGLVVVVAGLLIWGATSGMFG